MRSKTAILMIGISVLMGLVAVMLATQWLGQRAALATKTVVVASRDVPLGSALTADMLRTVDWPSSSMPEGAAADSKSLESRVVKATVQRGEPLLESKLAPIGTKGGLSSVIGEGKRAVTVKVNEIVGVAGFALPGNLVDVMVNTKDDNDRPISKIVLEQIPVLAVAQEASRDETKPKVVNAVTLELAPEQAEKLDLARSIGNLSLVLRNQLDNKIARTGGARKNDLLQIAPVKGPIAPVKNVERRARPAEAHKDKVEMIKGVQRSTVEF